MIITIAGQKGGSGKTAVCINLSIALATLQPERRIAIIDADEQQSTANLLKGHKHSNVKVLSIFEKPHRLIEEVRENYDVIFVDTPPHSAQIMYQSASVSDLVILPVQPSPVDVRAMSTTTEALTLVRANFNPGMICRFLRNRANPRTLLAQELRPTLEKFYPEYIVFDTVWQDREAYKRSLITGKSVIEGGINNAAASEVYDLLNEVLQIEHDKSLNASLLKGKAINTY